MPPDWRLFHVRRSTRKRIFFEVPIKIQKTGAEGASIADILARF
jgi:hypothetical protein